MKPDAWWLTSYTRLQELASDFTESCKAWVLRWPGPNLLSCSACNGTALTSNDYVNNFNQTPHRMVSTTRTAAASLAVATPAAQQQHLESHNFNQTPPSLDNDNGSNSGGSGPTHHRQQRQWRQQKQQQGLESRTHRIFFLFSYFTNNYLQIGVWNVTGSGNVPPQYQKWQTWWLPLRSLTLATPAATTVTPSPSKRYFFSMSILF